MQWKKLSTASNLPWLTIVLFAAVVVRCRIISASSPSSAAKSSPHSSAFTFHHSTFGTTYRKANRHHAITANRFFIKPPTYIFGFNISRRRKTKLHLRNFDLPETLIFYGIDTILDTKNYQICTTSSTSSSDSSLTIEKNDQLVERFTVSNQKMTIRPGVLRLMKESQEVNTPIVILSEHLNMEQIQSMIALTNESNEFERLQKDNILHLRSCLEEYKVDYTQLQDETNKNGGDDNDDDDEYEYPSTFIGQGIGHAPSPATLMDAIHSIFIEPRGFGGSSGFGVKHADAVRNPLPQHCVVFVSKSSDENPLIQCSRGNNDNLGNDERTDNSVSRDRCIASRTAGMRVMYLEDGCFGSCTAEDVSDGIIDTLGTESDWEMVTMDDISTPGSFWLNMAQPKDVNGDRVNAYDVVEYFKELRTKSYDCADTKSKTSQSDAVEFESNEIDEDEIQRILADLDPL